MVPLNVVSLMTPVFGAWFGRRLAKQTGQRYRRAQSTTALVALAAVNIFTKMSGRGCRMLRCNLSTYFKMFAPNSCDSFLCS
jgi:uncharacterized membrane protein